jgi:hypothetical protein
LYHQERVVSIIHSKSAKIEWNYNMLEKFVTQAANLGGCRGTNVQVSSDNAFEYAPGTVKGFVSPQNDYFGLACNVSKLVESMLKNCLFFGTPWTLGHAGEIVPYLHVFEQLI